MPVFALATLTPAALIAAGAIWGGVWGWLALGWMTVLTAGLDALIARAAPAAEGSEFPAADALAASLAVAHLALLPLAVLAAAGGTGLGAWERLWVALAAGMWFGQVTHPNAHELIHRPGRLLFSLGKWSYISLLIGHHVSAHRLVHHVRVGSREDPNTARLGEGFWRFWPRAWAGSFREGWRAERRRATGLANPYWQYVAGGLGFLALAWALAGAAGVLAWSALALYAQMQIFLSDYVQHYGLTRADGIERTSWNAPHWFSGHLMLNAPRHSDHHAHPARPFPALRLDASGPEPTLPHSVPVMAVIALFPGLWRRVMSREFARPGGGSSGGGAGAVAGSAHDA